MLTPITMSSPRSPGALRPLTLAGAPVLLSPRGSAVGMAALPAQLPPVPEASFLSPRAALFYPVW